MNLAQKDDEKAGHRANSKLVSLFSAVLKKQKPKPTDPEHQVNN
jgi:hypothetical protein